MRAFGSNLIACSLIIGSTMTSIAQQAVPLPKSVIAVKQKAESLAPQAHITVVRVGSPEEFGNFISYGQESFTFYDVDQKQNVTLKYEDVKKIKDGYGGYNSARGKHTDRSKRLVIVLVTVGVIGAVIGAAAAAK